MFKCVMETRISDINYGNHLDFTRLISLVQEARLRFLGEFGLTDLNLDENHGMMVKDIAAEYNNEVRWGDQLEFTINCERDGAKIVFLTEVKNIKNNQSVASVIVKMVVVKRDTHRPTKPDLFFEKIRRP